MCSRFAAANLYPQPDVPGYDDLIKKLAADNHARVRFLRACLGRLGLEVCQEEASTPPLSRLHLSAMDSAKVSDQLCAWEEVMDKEDGAEWIRGEADSFRIQSRHGSLELDELRRSLLDAVEEPGLRDDGHVDFAAIPKTIVAHESALPPADLTPRFDHELYYTSLRRFQAMEADAANWGNVLLYGEVVTSTNSLLDKSVSIPLDSTRHTTDGVLAPETPSSRPSCRRDSPWRRPRSWQGAGAGPTPGSLRPAPSCFPPSSTTRPTSRHLTPSSSSSTSPPLPLSRPSSRSARDTRACP